MTAEPLTLGEEAELRYVIDQSIREDYHYHPLTVKMLLATLDALRAGLDPERPEAVEAWAGYLERECIWHRGAAADSVRDCAAALLRARAEAERP
jgi:hypothetical protein